MALISLASRVSRPAPGQREEKEQLQLVCFHISEVEFGVDILMVREIIRFTSITPIPNAPSSILGVINLRGMIIPVVDLRPRLKIQGTPTGVDDRQTRILIMEVNSRLTGFIVDSVSKIIKVSMQEIEPTPDLVVASIDAGYLKGVIKRPQRLIILLDFELILKPREKQEIEEFSFNSSEEETDVHESDVHFSTELSS